MVIFRFFLFCLLELSSPVDVLAGRGSDPPFSSRFSFCFLFFLGLARWFDVPEDCGGFGAGSIWRC